MAGTSPVIFLTISNILNCVSYPASSRVKPGFIFWPETSVYAGSRMMNVLTKSFMKSSSAPAKAWYDMSLKTPGSPRPRA